jgi:hypothetical protein
MRLLLALLALLAPLALPTIGACACATEPERPKVLPISDPGKVFVDELEQRLLRAKSARIDAVMLASGAVNAQLSARLVLGEGQRARLDVEGTFESKPVKTWFMCDGTTMQVRGAASAPCAAEVRDALVLGFVRMGLLHNVAVLVGGGAPDHAAGNVHNWVRAERARSLEPATDVAFDVVVKHDVMGEAVLSLDNQARPIKRTQTVNFEEGTMNVVETYPRFDLDVDVSDTFPIVDAGPNDAAPNDAGPNDAGM